MTLDEAKLIHAAMKESAWGLIKAQLKDEVDRIKDINTVKTDRPADQIAVEVLARNLAYAALSGFLTTMGMFGRDPEKKPPLMRFR